MNSGFFLKLGAGAMVAALPLSGWSVPEPAPAQNITSTNKSEASGPGAEAGTNEIDIVNAPAKVVSTEITVPANIKLAPPVSEIVKLANSGVDQGVMLSYVTNSSSTFNLGADEIIYLKDVGIPGEVVTAMIQHDQVLRGEGAPSMVAQTPATEPTPPAEPPPGPEPQPPPAQAPTVEAPLTPPAGAEPAYSQFYGALSPYGTWINVNGYGLCWQPTAVVVNPGWSPYWDCGHWVYTDAGWYWYSDYSWGWAPFHYGRWFRHAHFGWCWAPDTVWGPSWVSWRYSDAYCGWAPLGPGVFFTVGIGFTYHGHYWHDWDRPWNHHFVAWRDFHDHDFHGHGVPHNEVTQVYNKTIVVNHVVVKNNVVINQGIPRDRVATATRTTIKPVALHETRNARPLNGRVEQLDPASKSLSVYRPAMAPSRSGSTTVASTKEVRPGRNAVSAPSASSSRAVAPKSASRAPAVADNSLKVIGRRDAAPVDVANRPAPTVARVQAAASGTVSGGTSMARPGPSPTRSSTAQVPSRAPASTTTRSSQATPWSSPQVANNAQPNPNTAYNNNNSATSGRLPIYQSGPRSAPVVPRYDRNTGSQASTTTPNYQAPARTAPQVPRYDRQYPAPANPAPSRPAPEVPRYNPAPQQRSYTPAPAPSYSRPVEAPRYSAPAPAPSRPAPAPPQAPSRGSDNNNGRR